LITKEQTLEKKESELKKLILQNEEQRVHIEILK